MLCHLLLLPLALALHVSAADLTAEQKQARELIQEAREACGAHCESRAEIGTLLSQTGDREASRQAFADGWAAAVKLQDQVERRIVLDGIATQQARAGQVPEALQAAQALVDSHERALALSAIVLVQAEARQREAALQTLERIPAAESRQKTQTRVEIALLLAEQNDVQHALRILQWNPEEAALATRLRGAAVLLEQLDPREQAVRTTMIFKSTGLITVAQEMARSGDLKGALQTVHRIPFQRQRDIGLLRILQAATDLKDLEFARAASQEIQEREFQEMSLVSIVTLMAHQSKQKQAQDLTDTIQDPTLKADALFQLATAQAARGEKNITQTLFNRAAALDRANSTNRNTAAQQIVTAYLKASRPELAAIFAAKMDDPKLRSQSFQALALANWQQKQTVAAKKDFAASRQAALKIKDAYQQGGRLRELALAQFETGDSNGARRTLALAQQAIQNIEIGGGTDVIALTELASTQQQMGDESGAEQSFEQARKAALRYPEKPYVAELLHSVACAQARAGQIESALQTARRETSDLYRSQMLLGIAGALLAPGRITR